MNLLKENEKKSFTFNIHKSDDSHEFGRVLYYLLLKKLCFIQPIVFVCIGSDRATGDSLGPITGYKLEKLGLKSVYIYGTLSNPVHAKNLEKTLQSIYDKYHTPLIIAIDACLGKIDHIGNINVGEGCIHPGTGVNKALPPVGDLFITGIVNFSGFMDMMVLQNTRLNTVMNLSDFICSGILWAYSKLKVGHLLDYQKNYN